MRKHLLFTGALILFTTLYFSAGAQLRGPGYRPASNSTTPPGPNSTGHSGTGANIDVIYHKIYWRISPDSSVKYIRGNVQTNFKTIVANVTSVSFDLNSVMTVDSVQFRGAKLAGGNITRSGNIVTIALGATLANNFIDSLTIYYQGTPPALAYISGAVGYQKASDAGAGNYIYTLSESYEDRDWWPCKADMRDKIDSMDITVSVPWASPGVGDTFWVASNGRMIDSTISGNSRIFSFRTRNAIPSYLVSVAVARYNKYYRSVNVNGTVVPVTYNIFRGKGSYVNILSKLDSMNLAVAAFSNKFGDYKFKNDKHGFYEGIEAAAAAGGMEHQTFSAIATSDIANAVTLSHELTHQWFGDNVTFASWNDLWLAEGFAAYGESTWYHELVSNHPVSGYQLRNNKKNTALSETVSAWVPDASCSTSDIWNNSYGSSIYNRGCMIVSMLRSISGDTKFYQALSNYQSAYGGKGVTTDSLKSQFNAVLGMDISPFFNDYVGGSGTGAAGVGGLGNPINTVNWNASANRLVIQMGTQTRSATNNGRYYRGPVVMHFTNAASSWTKDTTITIFDWGIGTGGVNTLSYAGNGVTDSIPGNILNFDLSFTPTNAFYDDSARTLTTGSMNHAVGLTGYTWTGTSSSSWNTATNWTNSIIAPTGAEVIVATTGSQPVLPGTITVGGLFLNAGTTLNIGNNTLIIDGPVSGTGTITGSNSSSITINDQAGTLNFDQTSTSTRSLNNLTISSGSSASLGTALDVYGTITNSGGTLNLNGKNLTLKSNAAGTARIGDLTGSILSGATNVTVERYIPNDGRRYRLLTPTVSTAGSIKTNWMEGGMNTVYGTNINPVPGYGAQVTGLSGNINGFDVTASNAPSLYLTNNGSLLTYTAVTSTAGTLNAKTGYFLFVRGDRTVDMTSTASTLPSSSTTLRTTGTLVTGTQSSFTNSLVGNSGFSLITNPYPSPIDWSLVQPACTGITNFYTLWDPNNGTRGGFVTVSTAGVASSGLATKFIQGGQAFFVQASGAPVPTVSIQESFKSAGNNNGIFGSTSNPESFSGSLFFKQADGTRKIADGVIALYDNSYSPAVDGNDGDEVPNWDENIAINRMGHHLAIESRPVILFYDTIPLFMNNMKQKDYEWEFSANNISNPRLEGRLIDNFRGTKTPVNVYGTTVISFTVSSDPLSAASDRFRVVFGPMAPSPIIFSNINAFLKNLSNGQASQGVQVDWVMQSEFDMANYVVERSSDGIIFTDLGTIASLGNSSGPVSYNWLDENPSTGSNFYRVRAVDGSGQVKYSSIVKVMVKNEPASISVFPNPVKGNNFSIQLTHLQKRTYKVELTNKLGQIVYADNLQHNGGSASFYIGLKSNIPSGIYDCRLIGDGIVLRTKIFKN